jgi:hypothetical protein
MQPNMQSNMQRNMRSNLESYKEEIKQEEPLGHQPRIMTTPQAKDGLELIKDNEIFKSLDCYNNKKSTIFSVNKQDDYDNNPYLIKIPDGFSPNIDDTEFNDENSQKIEAADEVELEDRIQLDKGDIPEIFKNSEIREKTGSIIKPRYFDSDGEGEGEYGFYEDYANSPNVTPPSGIVQV